MDDLFPVIVKRRDNLTDDITRFEFVAEPGAQLPPFTAGAHIRVATPGGHLRTYSLNNDEAERDRYVIAVKREDTGRGGSLSMHDGLMPGARADISAPINLLPVVPAPGYLLIAGGIGITPILSIARKLRRERHENWRLLYLARAPKEAAYLTELLSEDFRNHVTVHFSDTDGRIDVWPHLERQDKAHLYYCGPKGLMDHIYALTVHWPRSRVHSEEFTNVVSTLGNQPFQVRRASNGEIVDIPADNSIVEVFRQKGYKPKSSCETGTCRTCIVPMLGGEPDHRDLCLNEDERNRYFAPCVSRAAGDMITLDL